MKVGDIVIHPKIGEIAVLGKRHKMKGNAIVWYGIDRFNVEHDLTGEEKTKKEIQVENELIEKQEQEQKQKQNDLLTKTQRQKAIEDKILNDGIEVSVKNFPESEKNNEVLKDIHRAVENIETNVQVHVDTQQFVDEVSKLNEEQKNTTQAIKDIEIKEPIDYSQALLEIVKEIKNNKVDFADVIKGLNIIANKDIDLSLLGEVVNKLSVLEEVSMKIDNIKFEIPQKYIYKDHIKVSPDRVGSGSGGKTDLEPVTDVLKRINGENYDIIEIDNTDPNDVSIVYFKDNIQIAEEHIIRNGSIVTITK